MEYTNNPANLSKAVKAHGEVNLWIDPDVIRVIPERQRDVPESITALQALLAIDSAGLASVYEAWATSPDRTFSERAFTTRANVWKRDDPTLRAAAATLGLSAEQVDTLFISGATL